MGQATVIGAWLSAEQAFDAAALDADPDQPDLLATTVSPQLGVSQRLLAQMRASDEMARGTVQFGTPRLLTIGATTATVRSCIHDSEVVISVLTGRPVPGIESEVDDELITSTMESTSGGWKLATQTVGVGRCD